MKKVLLAIIPLLILTACGEPEPNMDSQDLREKQQEKKEETKKVDSRLDNTVAVTKGPYEPEMVANKDGEVYNKVVVPVGDGNLELTLPIIYFDFDKFEVKPEMMDELRVLVEKLKDENLESKTLSIGGHCDEWGTDEYNIALGLKRAKATQTALNSLGITSKMVLTSYGESKPVCMAHERKCWRLNRRTEIAILP